MEPILGSQTSLSETAADAYLTAADRLLSENKNDESLSVLKVLREAQSPKHINVAARFGEIREGSRNANDLMMSYLDDQDPALFRMGLELAHSLQDSEATQSLVKQLEKLSSLRQILFMHVLGGRGDAMALPLVIDATRSEDVDQASNPVAEAMTQVVSVTTNV